jgi:hypothetical protein
MKMMIRFLWLENVEKGGKFFGLIKKKLEENCNSKMKIDFPTKRFA